MAARPGVGGRCGPRCTAAKRPAHPPANTHNPARKGPSHGRAARPGSEEDACPPNNTPRGRRSTTARVMRAPHAGACPTPDAPRTAPPPVPACASFQRRGRKKKKGARREKGGARRYLNLRRFATGGKFRMLKTVRRRRWCALTRKVISPHFLEGHRRSPATGSPIR